MAQIKKDTSLRKAILQAAITGKLKIDNGELRNEETGKELLDRIIEERMSKEKMSRGLDFANAKSGKKKTKKETALAGSNPCDNIPEDEIPFEIPENWCWCRLGDVADKITDGTHKTPRYVSAGVKFISAKNVYDGKLDFGNCKYISDEEHKELFKRCNPEKNDLLLSKSGSIGTVVLNIYDFEFSLFESLALIKLNQNALSSIYFKYAIQYLCSFLTGNEIKGVAVKHLPIESIKNLLIPLPPLAVQNAIVAKLEQVLPLVDTYENAILQKEELKNALPDKVKKAILQEAITGKLTEAWRKSASIKESGKQLLDRIIEERNAKALAEWEESLKKNPKAKKPVPVVASEIEDDGIPFEVPESWCWCRLGDVIDLLSGRDLEPSAYNSISKGIPYMTGASNFDNEELIVNRWTDKPATISNLGDLLITCKGTIGELAFNNVGNVHIARQIMAIRKTEYINLKFLKFFLMSRIDDIQKQAKSMIPGISRDDMLGFEFPLPPLEEQEEIVKKVEELLSVCKFPSI